MLFPKDLFNLVMSSSCTQTSNHTVTNLSTSNYSSSLSTTTTSTTGWFQNIFFLFSRRPLGGVQQQQSCIFSPPPSRELLTSHTLYHHLPCIKVKNWLISKILFCFVLLVFTSYYFCENWKWLSPNIIVVVVCRFFFNT